MCTLQHSHISQLLELFLFYLLLVAWTFVVLPSVFFEDAWCNCPVLHFPSQNWKGCASGLRWISRNVTEFCKFGLTYNTWWMERPCIIMRHWTTKAVQGYLIMLNMTTLLTDLERVENSNTAFHINIQQISRYEHTPWLIFQVKLCKEYKFANMHFPSWLLWYELTNPVLTLTRQNVLACHTIIYILTHYFQALLSSLNIYVFFLKQSL